MILAGKAHPQDGPDQEMIHQWSDFIGRADLKAHAVFLEDYDMLLTQQLVQGVDVWVNTPRRPCEASGTSGMKVLVNGGLNVSEIDGWWAEAYSPDVGWAIGDRAEHGDDPNWDRMEAEQLYDVIEHQIVPRFYSRNSSGIPKSWVANMRESMASLAPYFSANRSVREYATRHYVPAAEAYKNRSRDSQAIASIEWHRQLDTHWPHIRFGALQVSTEEREHAFRVELYLGELNPDYIQMEIYADAAGAERVVRQPMYRRDRLIGTAGGYL